MHNHYPLGKVCISKVAYGHKLCSRYFQEKMSELMCTLRFVRTYLDDLLILGTGDIEDHLRQLEMVFQKLDRSGLKIHAEKSKFCGDQVGYLGYDITRNGLKPQIKKIQAIKSLGVPKNIRGVRRILGILQYYRDLWPKRSEILAPLTELTSTKGSVKTPIKILCGYPSTKRL